MLENDLLLRSAKQQETERTPVWLMRQAGRILPEYRQLRAQFPDFVSFVKNPEAAAEASLQPLDILGVDAVIVFSDILVIPEAMGLPYLMKESQGPFFPKTIENLGEVNDLKIASSKDFGYVMDAIKICKQKINQRVPLIGFAGAPFTIFCYMIEGKGSKTFSQAKKMLYTNPELSHALLNKITQSTIQYLSDQIDAGADLVQIFDSWAAALSPDQYQEFAAHYIAQICEALKQKYNNTPVTVFAKGAHHALSFFDQSSCDVIGLDWTISISDAMQNVKNKTLQGNMDPCMLYAHEGDIKAATEAMLKGFGKYPHIANLGHGLYPDTDFRKVKTMIDTVKNFRHQY